MLGKLGKLPAQLEFPKVPNKKVNLYNGNLNEGDLLRLTSLMYCAGMFGLYLLHISLIFPILLLCQPTELAA